MNSRVSLIHDLEDAIATGSNEQRVSTLRRVTDLFLLGADSCSEDQVAVFGDVIGRLADEIEIEARKELSDRLAPIANAPINVVKALASDDEIDVAGPVLSQSERLSEQDLINAAKAKGQDHLLAISKRQSLSEQVTDVLVTRGDQQVMRSVVQNEGARFSDTGFGVLVKRSTGDDVLAELVGLRKDIPQTHLRALVSKASKAVMEKLAAANPAAIGEIKKVLSELTGRIEENAPAVPRDYTAAKTSVESLGHAGKLDDSAVQDFASSGKFEETVVAISTLCRLPIEAVERAMVDDQSDTDHMLIVAKAAGLSWRTTKLVLRLQASGLGASPEDIENAQKGFHNLHVATAQRVVRFYQIRESATKGSS